MVVKQSVAKSLVVEVAGRALPAGLANTLVDGYVDDSRTLPDLFVLRFRDPSRVLLSQSGIAIGAVVTLRAGTGDEKPPEPLLTAEVTGLEVEIDDTGTFTVVRGLDQTHRLMRGRRVASYQNMTIADICGQVARRAGLRLGTVDVAGPVFDHVAQPNITDWEFVRGLAADAGAQAYVVDGALNVTWPTQAGGAPDPATRSSQSPLVLEMGSNLLRCRVGVTAAEQVNTVEVRGWDVRAKRAVVGRADAGRSSTLRLGVSAADLTRPFGAASFSATDVAYGTQAEVDQAASALAERIAGSFAELEAVIHGNPQVRAGQAVSLSGVGAPFEGRYTVTSTRHVFDSLRGYETWITVSGQQDRSLYGLSGGAGPDEAGGGSRFPGLVTATVSDNKDPQKQGRVKVTFPWLSDDYASDWARTGQFGGAGGGGLSVPGVGDEVLVGFEQGRMDRPFVLAGLYNGQDAPTKSDTEAVDGTSGAVNRRTFGTRNGHRLDLLDAAAGPQGVRLATGDDKLTVHLDGKGTAITVHSDGTVEVKASDKVTITADRGVSLNAGNGALELSGQSVSVKARGGVELDGGSGQVKLSTGGTVDVQGTQVAVNGTTRTEIKGGMTCSINAAMVRIN